jgi:hypothetical protein
MRVFILLCAILIAPNIVIAECKGWKVVEYSDRVEAVCIGSGDAEIEQKVGSSNSKKSALEEIERNNIEIQLLQSRKALKDVESRPEREAREAERLRQQEQRDAESKRLADEGNQRHEDSMNKLRKRSK